MMGYLKHRLNNEYIDIELSGFLPTPTGLLVIQISVGLPTQANQIPCIFIFVHTHPRRLLVYLHLFFPGTDFAVNDWGKLRKKGRT